MLKNDSSIHIQVVVYKKLPVKGCRMANPLSFRDTCIAILRRIQTDYRKKLYDEITKEPDLIGVIPGFLLQPDKVICYLGSTHIGIEYVGREYLTELPNKAYTMEIEYFDFSEKPGSLLNNILGYDFGTMMEPLPLPTYSEDLVCPTNEGFDALHKVGWNFLAQDMIFALNSGGMTPVNERFSRIINGKFFDSNENGLMTRHIKCLDFLPLELDTSDPNHDQISLDLSELVSRIPADARTPYPIPQDFKWKKLPLINDFVQCIADKTNKETDITKFLADEKYAFILKMRFSAESILDEKKCYWQSVDDKDPIKPDFFVVGTDGYANIVEFKLPNLKSKIVIGKNNRETFSAEINSHISQTRDYREYFDDPNNRKWVEDKYGFKIYKPKRFLIIGRRWDFDPHVWKQIEADYTDLTILTYDDLIDGVSVQFYN